MIYVLNRQLKFLCTASLYDSFFFCYEIIDLGCTYFNSKLNKIWHRFSKEDKHGTITSPFDVRF